MLQISLDAPLGRTKDRIGPVCPRCPSGGVVPVAAFRVKSNNTVWPKMITGALDGTAAWNSVFSGLIFVPSLN